VQGYGRFGCKRMKKVIHLGPADSRGGMSMVIHNLALNTPVNYQSEIITTHCEGAILKKINIWINARNILKNKINANEVDIVHIHATHSISWWRKINLMNICKKNSIPVIIHIHSGRFQDFCKGFFGISGFLVRRSLATECRVIVLEDRWKEILKKWMPNDVIVIPNSSERTVSRKNILSKKIKILMLSRKSKGKGHDFAIKILRSLESKGINVKLTMTGVDDNYIKKIKSSSIDAKGWVTKEEKMELIKESDFLIMPSEFEGSSMSVIESMINCLPCLVSPASSETVGINELVIPLDRVEEWSDKIISLTNQDEYDKIIKLINLQSEKYSKYNNKQNIKKLYDEISLPKQQ